MHPPIYNLSLLPFDLTPKSSDAPNSIPYIPTTPAYSDLFHKDRAPSPRELIQHLVGTAYACATLNADLVASTSIKLYVTTRPGDVAPKQFFRPQKISKKTQSR